MGVKLPPDRMLRVTRWEDHEHNVLQVGVAVLDRATWEVLCQSIQGVGPFDNVADVLAATITQALEWAVGTLGVEMPGPQPD